jgi:hypothetical protein
MYLSLWTFLHFPLSSSDIPRPLLLLQGTYKYPDGSHYTGSWQGGKKHGAGTYWDATGGCLAGDWVGGVLAGQGRYDQAHYHFEGKFVKGIPAGEGGGGGWWWGGGWGGKGEE